MEIESVSVPSVPLNLHFIPSGPINPTERRAMRSHVTLDTRRKQRRQKLLSLQTKPSRPKGIFLEDNLCRCSTIPQTFQHSTTGKKALKSRSIIQKQLTADSYKICTRCRGIHFAALSEEGQLKAASAHPAVVTLLQSGFDPFNTMPEVPNLSPSDSQIIHELKVFFLTFMSPGELKTTLLPAAVQTPALLMGILYFTCSGVAAIRDEKAGRLANLAWIIKRQTINQINKRLSSPDTAYTTETISAIGYLSAGIWTFGEKSAPEEVIAHERGLLLLVPQGPTWEPGEDQRLGRSMVKLLILHKFLHSALSDVPMEEHLFMKYGIACPAISSADNFAESPLFCPQEDFKHIRKSKALSERTLDLLRAMRALVIATLAVEGSSLRFIEHHAYTTAKESLYSLLLPKESASKETDYVFECCHLAALMMIQAIDSGISFNELDNSLAEQLKSAMQNTDIGNVWGQMSGVLWWVCLVGASVAVIGTPQHSYMDTVLRRTMLELTYKSSPFEAVSVATANFVRIKASLRGRKR